MAEFAVSNFCLLSGPSCAGAMTSLSTCWGGAVEFIKQEAKVQAAESSPHCVAAACDAVMDVTGQTDAPYKRFYKLQQRHRDVSCHSPLRFPSEKVYT